MTANPISLKTCRIQSFAETTDAPLSNASGFLCTFKGLLFLVTNWHIATGRRPDNDQPIHPSGAVPGRLRVVTYNSEAVDKVPEDGSNYDVRVGEANFDIELHSQGTPNWIENPTYGKQVDVVVFLLCEAKEKPLVDSFNIENHIASYESIPVMGNVFIVGYPLTREKTNNMFPIYKSGTVASEPGVHDAEPRFHVDSKTKSGMSGSPVIFTRTRPASVQGSKITLPSESTSLIGIYAGRDGIAQSEFEAELGRVYPLKECLLPILHLATSHL